MQLAMQLSAEREGIKPDYSVALRPRENRDGRYTIFLPTPRGFCLHKAKTN
jgi:hypothetical protein